MLYYIRSAILYWSKKEASYRKKNTSVLKSKVILVNINWEILRQVSGAW